MPSYHVLDIINAYIWRQLTFSNDILNAFVGIMQASGSLSIGTKFLWGIPVLEDVQSTLLQLFWFNDYDVGMSSMPSDRDFRRSGFPSWSWVGWKFAVRFGLSTFEGRLKESLVRDPRSLYRDPPRTTYVGNNCFKYPG